MAVLRGQEKQWTMCIINDLKAIGITTDWKKADKNGGRWCGTVKDGAEAFMAEKRETEIVATDARHAEEAAEEAKKAAHSAVGSGVTARQAFTFKEAFDGPTPALPPPRKSQCQSQNTRAAATAETGES